MNALAHQVGKQLGQPHPDQRAVGHPQVPARGLVHVREAEVHDRVGVVAHGLEEHVRIEQRVEGRIETCPLGLCRLSRLDQRIEMV